MLIAEAEMEGISHSSIITEALAQIVVRASERPRERPRAGAAAETKLERGR
jgi:hypothetical protein